MLDLGPGCDRRRVRDALRSGEALTIRYEGVLSADDIREAVAGVREAGSPKDAVPILVWFASHPNTPEDVQGDLLAGGPREVCQILCLNPRLPEELRRRLLEHPDVELRQHAQDVFARQQRP